MEINCPNCYTILVINDKTKSNEIVCYNCTVPFTIPIDMFNDIIESNKKDEIIHKNYLQAYTDIPHTLIPSKRIYISGKVNDVEIKFLVDTGAAVSILPVSYVSACNINDIVDEKYSGTLNGVGVDKIMGRIYYLEVQLSCGVYPCSFTVCKNDQIGPIIGIDMMRNLGIIIDFAKNKLLFENGKYEISFE